MVLLFTATVFIISAYLTWNFGTKSNIPTPVLYSISIGAFLAALPLFIPRRKKKLVRSVGKF